MPSACPHRRGAFALPRSAQTAACTSPRAEAARVDPRRARERLWRLARPCHAPNGPAWRPGFAPVAQTSREWFIGKLIARLSPLAHVGRRGASAPRAQARGVAGKAEAHRVRGQRFHRVHAAAAGAPLRDVRQDRVVPLPVGAGQEQQGGSRRPRPDQARGRHHEAARGGAGLEERVRRVRGGRQRQGRAGSQRHGAWRVPAPLPGPRASACSHTARAD